MEERIPSGPIPLCPLQPFAVLVTGQLPSTVPQPEQTPGHLEVTSFSTCVTVLQYVVALTDPGDLAL